MTERDPQYCYYNRCRYGVKQIDKVCVLLKEFPDTDFISLTDGVLASDLAIEHILVACKGKYYKRLPQNVRERYAVAKIAVKLHPGNMFYVGALKHNGDFAEDVLSTNNFIFCYFDHFRSDRRKVGIVLRGYIYPMLKDRIDPTILNDKVFMRDFVGTTLAFEIAGADVRDDFDLACLAVAFATHLYIFATPRLKAMPEFADFAIRHRVGLQNMPEVFWTSENVGLSLLSGVISVPPDLFGFEVTQSLFDAKILGAATSVSATELHLNPLHQWSEDFPDSIDKFLTPAMAAVAFEKNPYAYMHFPLKMKVAGAMDAVEAHWPLLEHVPTKTVELCAVALTKSFEAVKLIDGRMLQGDLSAYLEAQRKTTSSFVQLLLKSRPSMPTVKRHCSKHPVSRLNGYGVHFAARFKKLIFAFSGANMKEAAIPLKEYVAKQTIVLD
jgi:hypothetical protein